MKEFLIILLLGTAFNLWAQNFTPEHIEKLNKLKNITYEDQLQEFSYFPYLSLP